MRIGVLGGTFDPIHVAHLLLAEQAREQLVLDKVLFVPAGDPWRKSERVVTPALQRLEMVHLAVEGAQDFEVDEREIRREGPTYTVETLRELRDELGEDDDLFLLLGEDAVADMPNWYEASAITDYAVVAMAPREDSAMPAALPIDPAAIERVELPYLEISSTDLRTRARMGRSLRYLVPDAVAAYVTERGLYLE